VYVRDARQGPDRACFLEWIQPSIDQLWSHVEAEMIRGLQMSSRTFTPHRETLFPYVNHLRKLSCQRKRNSFWSQGHRWWRVSINISIETCQNLIEPSCISSHYWTQGSRSSTSGQHASTLTIHNCTRLYIVVWDYITWRLTWSVLCSQKYDLNWGL
jgi:hypothetical protein